MTTLAVVKLKILSKTPPSLPEVLKGSLPTIEEIEAELGKEGILSNINKQSDPNSA
jgi:hypothetical protein